jgi:hypothetical protein
MKANHSDFIKFVKIGPFVYGHPLTLVENF